MASLFVISCVALTAVHQTASRLTWSFARDNALYYSSRLVKVHPSLNVPILALILNGILVGLVGIIYVISTTGPPPLPLNTRANADGIKQLSTPSSAQQ